MILYRLSIGRGKNKSAEFEMVSGKKGRKDFKEFGA
jgi:hypothetical protein